MHELFMTAVVPDSDVYVARQLLQGYCSATETHTINRLLFYRGPDRPAGFNKVPELDKTPNRRLWKDLHQFFTKQSFIVQARYRTEPTEFGQDAATAAPVNLDQRRGALRWSDIPDPLPPQAMHTQRKMLDIYGQERLIEILTRNGHIFKSECVEERYTWWQNAVEFSLERNLTYPQPQADVGQGAPPPQTQPRASLPPFSELGSVGGVWMLHVKCVVPDPTPERMAAAAASLAAVRNDLRGNFAFKQFDRRVHDTRYRGAPVNNMPIPLPQVVTVGRE